MIFKYVSVGADSTQIIGTCLKAKKATNFSRKQKYLLLKVGKTNLLKLGII